MKFWLGTHQTGWLNFSQHSLCVSDRRLKTLKHLPTAASPWLLDSGGFSELSLYGGWITSPLEYTDRCLRYFHEIGNLQHIAPQDWMCEPFMIKKTGLTIQDHQQRTVTNFIRLTSLNTTLPFFPVLQGYSLEDYQRHRQMYDNANINLASYPLVGLGSVCRRQSTQEIHDIVSEFSDLSLHGFGVKKKGLESYGHLLASADSMAWSFYARRLQMNMCGKGSHANCANCFDFASYWKESLNVSKM